MKFDLEKIIGKQVHCDTEEKAVALLKFLHENGYRWTSGDDLTEKTLWRIYKLNTCYEVRENKNVKCADITCELDWIEFENVIEQEETMKYYNLVFINHGTGINYLFKLPLGIQLEKGQKIYVDTMMGETTGDCVTDSFIVDEYTKQQIVAGSRAYEPLKEVIGWAEKQDGYRCIDFRLVDVPF